MPVSTSTSSSVAAGRSSRGTTTDVMARDSPVAVVTGAGSGIGRAVAASLLAEGYRVALAGRRREPLETLGAGFPVVTDVRDPASVDALFSAVLERYGRVDLLFNNAGLFGLTA